MNIKIVVILSLLIVSVLFPQSGYEKEYIIITPGERYEASGFHEFFFGAHWRDVWTTPVKVEVLDLDNFAGGLTPIKKGGGYQTKSLRFKGEDGEIWKFRSLDKDPSKVLPPDLQETVASDIIQDQISTANPMAPFVVEPLLEAVGVLSAKPKLVYLPDDEKLGKFRDEFGDMLGILEIHPSEGEDDEEGFEGALDVKGTYKLLNHLEEKRGQNIDSREFLKARLMDILLGDWDRHMDQWRWAKYEVGDDKLWYPIPRDRDQAFSKYDGVFPFFAEYLVPQLNHFGYDYPQIEDLTWNGRFLDRRVLTELTKNTWDSVTALIRNSVTDDVIDNAVRKLPPEYYDICSEEITGKLKSRRDYLDEASNGFYRLVNRVADVFCSAKNDFVEVNRIDDNSTAVSVYKRDKDSGDKKGKPLFSKVFDNKVTKDIRVHMNDGDDKVYVSGECDYSPIVRIIGGKGKDEFIDESIVYGYLFSFTPFPAVKSKTYFYDSGDKTRVVEGPGTCFDNYKWHKPQNDQEKYEPEFIDRGNNWLPVPVLAYDSDYGLTIGGGAALLNYNFRAVPLESMQRLTVSYATRFGSFAAAYEGDFYSILKNSRLNIFVTASERFVTRYFGYGNETSFDSDLESDDFYEVDQSLITIFPRFHYNFTNSFAINVGLSLIQTTTSLENDTLLAGFKYDDYGTGTLNPLGIHFGLELDGRDNILLPLNGYFVSVGGSVYPAIFNIPESFYHSSIGLKGFITNPSIKWITLALRAGAEKVWGKYPFFAGATLGGPESIRGYNQDRFSGDASVFGQAELRLFITEVKLILKSRFGINIFAETGRVFTENDDSDKWHPSYGFGIWFSYFNSQIVPAAYVAFSPERTTFAFGLGMGF